MARRVEPKWKQWPPSSLPSPEVQLAQSAAGPNAWNPARQTQLPDERRNEKSAVALADYSACGAALAPQAMQARKSPVIEAPAE
jgi:hypothetical protein